MLHKCSVPGIGLTAGRSSTIRCPRGLPWLGCRRLRPSCASWAPTLLTLSCEAGNQDRLQYGPRVRWTKQRELEGKGRQVMTEVTPAFQKTGHRPRPFCHLRHFLTVGWKLPLVHRLLCSVKAVCRNYFYLGCLNV